MESWRLPEIATPTGTRSPVVLKSEDEARAVLIGLDPGQQLGDHQVKEHAWLLVVEGTARIEAGRAVDTFRFHGSGYGHGIGMSQWGAYGLAQKGWSHRKILTHFYSHTRVAASSTLPKTSWSLSSGTPTEITTSPVHPPGPQR